MLAARGFRAEKEPDDTRAKAQYVNASPARVLGTLQAAYREKVDVVCIHLSAWRR